MAWIPKATIALANDFVMSVTVLDPSSATRAAIQSIANTIVSEGLATDPVLADRVLLLASTKVDEAIANRNLVQALVTTTTDDAVTGLVDQLGNRFPGAQWDAYGRPSNTMMRTFANRGMLRADEGVLTSAVFKDALGERTWISIGSDGGFDHATFTYLGNRLRIVWDDTEPWVYPGKSIYWVDTSDPALPVYRLDN